VLVERVEKFATREQWQRAYDEINGFERTLVAEGTIIIKFWMHLSSAEQLARFKRRAEDPFKSWKLTDEDWRNRKRRRSYEGAVEDMLERTSTEHAPWHLVEGDSKRYARVRVLEATIGDIERGMRDRGFEPPTAPVDGAKARKRDKGAKRARPSAKAKARNA
jgi:polyphosphate kinase 2 (PPK2 family)